MAAAAAADAKGARGSFPVKLYELVEGQSTANRESHDEVSVVSWCEGGLAFIVRDMTRFCEEVLPQHFCHNKWASFIRQLNLYGFRRITQGQSSGAYWHKYFQRGQPQLLRGITRSRRSANGPFEGDDDEGGYGPTSNGGADGITAPTPGGFGDKLKRQAAARPAVKGYAATAPWGGQGGAVAPMHSGVPLPQMPRLSSLAQLPPPPIISDEALLRELDSLVQQQKAHHEKLATPSPAGSSNSLQRLRTDAKISAAGLRNAPPISLPTSRLPLSRASSNGAGGGGGGVVSSSNNNDDENDISSNNASPIVQNNDRKRIASHQSVHSVGSLDRGEMSEIGGHPLQKKLDVPQNMRTMSKSSLASDDWDLNIAEVDLNLDDWRWSEANNSLNRSAGAFSGAFGSLNNSLDLSSRGRTFNRIPSGGLPQTSATSSATNSATTASTNTTKDKPLASSASAY